MSDDKEKDNVVDIFSKVPVDENPKTSGLMRLSDDIDDVLNAYLYSGMSPDMVAAVLSNRLGTLISAMRSAGIDDSVDVYTQIVIDTVKNEED
jgi:hypothetical protein